MYNYDVMGNFDVNGSKYNLPEWMVDEQMYNCEGFTVSYYNNLFSRALNKLKFWK